MAEPASPLLPLLPSSRAGSDTALLRWRGIAEGRKLTYGTSQGPLQNSSIAESLHFLSSGFFFALRCALANWAQLFSCPDDASEGTRSVAHVSAVVRRGLFKAQHLTNLNRAIVDSLFSFFLFPSPFVFLLCFYQKSAKSGMLPPLVPGTVFEAALWCSCPKATAVTSCT